MKITLSTPLKNFAFNPSEHWISACLSIVEGELLAREINFTPKLWVSDDWYCLDGTIGISIPFYLASDELASFVHSSTGGAEGRTSASAIKILRHEIGHAIDNAYSLRKNEERQQLFGPSSRPYPNSYHAVNISSSNYVNYLGGSYAQSHPDEDFAETFAVWLSDRRWRSNYRGEALKKLRLMDKMMHEIRNKDPKVKKFLKVDAVAKDERSLGDYIKDKNLLRRNYLRGNFGKVLLNTFAKNSKRRDNSSAHEFLKSNRSAIVKKVALSTKLKNTEVIALMRRFEETSMVHNLVMKYDHRKAEDIFVGTLSTKAKSLIDYGWHKVPM